MKLIQNIFRTLAFTLILAGAVSCTDDELKGGDEDRPTIEGDNYVLSFKISLSSMQGQSGGTRQGEISGVDVSSVEEYEDYIDPNKMYVMFFIQGDKNGQISNNTGSTDNTDITDKTDNTDITTESQSATDNSGNPYRLFWMFGPGDTEYSALPVADDSKGNKNWYVRISIPDMTANAQGKNDRIDGETFAETLRKHDFKIAVMANAENDKKIILKKAEVIGNIVQLGDDLNLIHHQTGAEDPYYVASTIDEEGKEVVSNATKTYGFLYKNTSNSKYMGYYTDWVKYKDNESFSDQDGARAWIRKNWTPSLEKPMTWANDYYTDLWQLWNFGGNIENNAVPYGTSDVNYEMTPEYKEAWDGINGEKIRTEITKAKQNGGIESFATSEYELDAEGNIVLKAGEPTFLHFVNNYKKDYEKYPQAIVEEVDKDKCFYGIKLFPCFNFDTKGRIREDGENAFFKFRAHATGTLYITCRHAGPSENDVKLRAEIGKSVKFEDFSIKYNKGQLQTVKKPIQITTDEQDVFIYMMDNKGSDHSLDIFQIEFVQDKYLNDTYRTGIAPSKEQPIPMYGIQSFKALGNFWPAGTNFDLNNYHATNNYDSPTGQTGIDDNGESFDKFEPKFRSIPLMRSVAKVVVLIPSALQPEYVFLRSANRLARWEPVDVVSDTHDIWTDDHEDFSIYHSKYCEFFHIIDQKPFYNPSDSPDDNAELKNYKEKLAWYYKAWADETEKVGDVKPIEGEKGDHGSLGSFDYPHILNPLIQRSDFIEFMSAGTEATYNKYVLYVPEKFVDDPDSKALGKALESADPKVAHIEFRLKNDPHSNLDDNNCYRIYFIDGGVKHESYIPNLSDDAHSWENVYEKNPEVLQGHWPIMRNHTYTFSVKDVSSRIAIVNLEVLPWQRVNDISVAW